MLRHVSEWQQLYADCAGFSDFDKLWRAAFTDRNIWLYYIHKRNPLSAKRLAEIDHWWRSWNETGDGEISILKSSLATIAVGTIITERAEAQFRKTSILLYGQG
jgi:hypothetical protein